MTAGNSNEAPAPRCAQKARQATTPRAHNTPGAEQGWKESEQFDHRCLCLGTAAWRGCDHGGPEYAQDHQDHMALQRGESVIMAVMSMHKTIKTIWHCSVERV